MPKKGECNQYILYKGDNILAQGTVFEIAEKLNVNVSTVRYYQSKHYAEKSRNPRLNIPRRRLVKVEVSAS